MRQIVSVFRLLNIVAEKKDKDEVEEAKTLEKAIKKGKAKLTFHIEINSGEIEDIKIGDWFYQGLT